MKLSTIMANYDEFQSSYKKIGYTQKTINITDKRQLRLLLETVIEDILIFNDILNVYDYDKQEKKQILAWINKLGRKKETFLQMLVELNIENYYEDSSITEDDYTDLHLFESSNIGDFSGRRSKARYEIHYTDKNGIRGMDKLTDWNKVLKFVENKVSNKEVRELAVYKDAAKFHSTTQEEFLELWWGENSYWSNINKKDGSVRDTEFIMNLNESDVDIVNEIDDMTFLMESQNQNKYEDCLDDIYNGGDSMSEDDIQKILKKNKIKTDKEIALLYLYLESVNYHTENEMYIMPLLNKKVYSKIRPKSDDDLMVMLNEDDFNIVDEIDDMTFLMEFKK